MVGNVNSVVQNVLKIMVNVQIQIVIQWIFKESESMNIETKICPICGGGCLVCDDDDGECWGWYHFCNEQFDVERDGFLYEEDAYANWNKYCTIIEEQLDLAYDIGYHIGYTKGWSEAKGKWGKHD